MNEHNTQKQRKGYERLVDRLSEHVIGSERLQVGKLVELVEEGRELLHAAGDMTKDEASLVASYVKRDLHAFADGWHHERHAMRDWLRVSQVEKSLWHLLTEMSDRTQLEWHELSKDFAHRGSYFTDEVVGHGLFSCKKCGRSLEITAPTVLQPCRHCGHSEYERKPLQP